MKFPSFRQTRYLSSLIWGVPLVVLSIVGATLAWVTYDKFKQTHESEYRLLEAHARYAEAQVGRALGEVERLLAEVADERKAVLKRGGKSNPARFLEDVPAIHFLLIADARGHVDYSSYLGIRGRSVAGMDFFTLPATTRQAGRMFISRPEKNLLDSVAMVLSLPILGDDGRFLGIVAVVIDHRFFAQALRPVNPEDSESVSVIFNRDGDLVYRRFEAERFFGMNIAQRSKVYQKHIQAGTRVTRDLGPGQQDGMPRLFVTRSIENSGLNVIVSRREEEVLEQWKRNLLIHGLIFFFTAAVIVILARIAQRRHNQLQDTAEDLRRAKEAAESANAGKSRFLAAASHDLRQPLHAMMLLVSVLRKRHRDEDSQRIIRPIEASAQALKEMLDTLLDISKLDAGVVVPQIQAVSVNTLVERLESEYHLQFDEKGLALRLHRCTEHIESDPNLLMEILRNLLSNALHYTAHGGVLLGFRKRGEHLLIQVWDTGKGIAEEEQDKIFNEYYQIANPERDRHKGLGLGLSIVERMARLLGHPIGVRSRPGKGSMFQVSVPLTGAVPPSANGQQPAPPAQRNAIILVIDDDQVVLQGTALLLESQGFTALCAESADEALKLAEKQIPDLIIADYRLRENLSGIDAIARLRAYLGKEIPALLVSGDTLPARLREASASGLKLLSKPVDPEELNAQFSALLDKTPRPGKS